MTPTDGCLEVLCGPMFSGKTEALIRIMQDAQPSVAVFKPSMDTRFAVAKVVSHSRMEISAIPIPVSLPSIILERLGGARVIGIDEAQFFDESISSIVNDLVDQGVRVIAAGLDLDYRGVPFGAMPRLLAMADRVTKLTARCTTCGGDATRTQRLIKSANLVEIGASESYAARCRPHFSVP